MLPTVTTGSTRISGCVFRGSPRVERACGEKRASYKLGFIGHRFESEEGIFPT